MSRFYILERENLFKATRNASHFQSDEMAEKFTGNDFQWLNRPMERAIDREETWPKTLFNVSIIFQIIIQV